MTTYSKETALYDTGAIKNGIDEAATTADNYLTDVTGGGVMVHPSDDSTTGWKISSALELLKSGVSYIWAGLVNSIATVRIGKESGGHSVIDENGMRIYGNSDGTTQLANIGYGDGTSSGSSVIKGPYYTFGQRTNNWTVGNYSVAMGTYAIADGYCAVANGSGARASGHWSHASGLNTIASMYAQTVVGSSNIADTEPDIALHPTGNKKYGHYAFIVGNGKDSERSNALTVDWGGGITVQNHSSPIGSIVDGYLASAKSVPNNSNTMLFSMSLTAGTWLVECGVRFPANGSGFRRANFATTSAAADAQMQFPPATASGVTQYRWTTVAMPTSTTTYYLNCYQNSGSALTMPASGAGYGSYARAIRIL